MAWFAELAGKAENLLNDLDEQTGAALRSHNVTKSKKHDRQEIPTYPGPTWTQKKRPIPRTLRKFPTSDPKSNYVPNRKPSPTSRHEQTRDSQDGKFNLPKPKKPSMKKPYTLNNCPRTLVGEVGDTEIIFDNRRYSLPSDLEVIGSEDFTYRMENMEIENAMLKNELNVMNREVADLLDRLRKAEDGEDIIVDSSKELCLSNKQFENTKTLNYKVNVEKNSLKSELEQLKAQINNITILEVNMFRDKKKEMEAEIGLLKERNSELENMIRKLNDKTDEKDASQMKLENDLRHAQSTIIGLQSDLDKSNAECKRLEKEWETYKYRVKGMLAAKDKEVKALQEGMNLTEDTKILVEQIDNLRKEREVLSAAVARVHGESSDMKQYVESLETRHNAAERVVLALRDALKDERAARNRAETQCSVMAKELKSIQLETGQTIASLRTALRDKDNELHQIKDSTSSVRTVDTSALNVGDYDVSQDSIDSEKMCYLTQKLIHSQGKIDKLVAENNMMRIQCEKLQSKHKIELQAANVRKNTHSVVQFQDGDQYRLRSHHQKTPSLTKLSQRIDVFIRRNPLFRIMIIIYMIGLHFWVLTVLFTSTPENYNTLNKS